MLGIIDWGIGGISIYKLIKERLGKIPIVYLSDTGVTPYGKMSRRELIGRLNAVIAFLKTQGMTHLVIGCNAASTVIPFLDLQGIKLIGMIDSGIAAAEKERPERLGLIGGRRTVLSGVYRKAFAVKGIAIEQRIAQPLSGMIESSDTDSEQLRAACAHILGPLKGCSHILLACTHYPAITKTLKEFVLSQTSFIDPAFELLNKVSKWKIQSGQGDRLFTTGDVRLMQRAALNAWGFEIKGADHIRID